MEAHLKYPYGAFTVILLDQWPLTISLLMGEIFFRRVDGGGGNYFSKKHYPLHYSIKDWNMSEDTIFEHLSNWQTVLRNPEPNLNVISLRTPSPPWYNPSPPDPGARLNLFRITGYLLSKISGSVNLKYIGFLYHLQW